MRSVPSRDHIIVYMKHKTIKCEQISYVNIFTFPGDHITWISCRTFASLVRETNTAWIMDTSTTLSSSIGSPTLRYSSTETTRSRSTTEAMYITKSNVKIVPMGLIVWKESLPSQTSGGKISFTLSYL